MNNINNNNDKLINTTSKHGSDISSQRIDELDHLALQHAVDISHKQNASAVDLGAGLGSQGIRFANLNINTLLIDNLDISKTINKLNKLTPHITDELTFLNKDITKLDNTDLPKNIDIIFSQRFIHYLTYNEAKKLLSLLRQHIDYDGKLYLSTSGLNSELSQNYADVNTNVKNRYSELSQKMAEKHNIKVPVCLYSKIEFKNLIKDCDFMIEKIYKSDFGNIKVIASVK